MSIPYAIAIPMTSAMRRLLTRGNYRARECQLPTPMGLSVDSRSTDTNVSAANSVAVTVIIPDFRAY